jgi:hypothetical protein
LHCLDFQTDVENSDRRQRDRFPRFSLIVYTLRHAEDFEERTFTR